MTCIVGLVENEKVYIGGDSAGVGGFNVRIRKDSKVFKVGEFLFGCTSSFRMIQILRFSFTPPEIPNDKDVFEYMCTAFVDELRKVLGDGGFKETDKGAETGGTFLVGVRGRLFCIENDFQVGENVDNYNSCGCGENYAMGSLFSSSKKLSPEKKIEKALQAAAYFSGGVEGPFIIESI